MVWHALQHYAVLHCAALCCQCIMLCYNTLSYTTLCSARLDYAVPNHMVLQYTKPPFTIWAYGPFWFDSSALCVFLLLEMWPAPLIPFSFYVPSKITSWGRCGRTCQVVAEPPTPLGHEVKNRLKKKNTSQTSLDQLSVPLSWHTWPKAIQQRCEKEV